MAWAINKHIYSSPSTFASFAFYWMCSNAPWFIIMFAYFEAFCPNAFFLPGAMTKLLTFFQVYLNMNAEARKSRRRRRETNRRVSCWGINVVVYGNWSWCRFNHNWSAATSCALSFAVCVYVICDVCAWYLMLHIFRAINLVRVDVIFQMTCWLLFLVSSSFFFSAWRFYQQPNTTCAHKCDTSITTVCVHTAWNRTCVKFKC